MKYFNTLLLVLLTVGFAWGQETAGAKKKKGLPLFEHDEVLEVKLEQNVKALKKDIDEDRTYHPARLTYSDPIQLQEVTLNVSVKTRGKTRRNPRLCDSPPLAIKFNTEETKNTIFRKQKKLKLVTHCKKNKTIFEQYLFQEYLAYRAYNVLTDKSFRVRLVRIAYVDSEGKYKPVTRYAFFIEDEKKMAKRLDGKLDESTQHYWVFQQKDAQILVSVFQFLIGNTDWSIPARHNVKILRVGPKESLYAVPYDFDMSGIVNTSYARPHEKLQDKISSVRTRWYRGLCRKQEEFAPVIALFNERKAALYAVYEDFRLLSGRSGKSTLRYLDDFYEIINKPRKVKKHLVENCKKLK